LAKETRQAKGTVGISPKVQAGAAGAFLTPLVARLVADLFGIEVDEEALEAFLTALFALLGAATAAYVAPPGKVKVETGDK
jgi:hypothetical protein